MWPCKFNTIGRPILLQLLAIIANICIQAGRYTISEVLGVQLLQQILAKLLSMKMFNIKPHPKCFVMY